MSDTRSKAAEEWMRSQVMRVWTDDILPEIESAHLAGHEHMAAIKDAEIAQLKERISRYERTQVDWPIVEGEYKAEIAALREAVKDFLCECTLVDKFRQYETWQITPWSMDELMKMVEEEP